MMGEFDESVRVALRERASGVVRVEDLLAGARQRGMRRRRLRHALLGGGTASAVAVVVLVSALVTGPRSGVDVVVSSSGSTLPRPPAAEAGDGNSLRLDVADPEANRWSGPPKVRSSRYM